MAYHESHERSCPYCDARISATAPKCLSCGEYVNDDAADSDDDPEAKAPPRIAEIAVGIVIAILCVALLVYMTW